MTTSTPVQRATELFNTTFRQFNHSAFDEAFYVGRIVTVIEDAANAQLVADSEAMCAWCGDENFLPSEWTDEDNGYIHQPKHPKEKTPKAKQPKTPGPGPAWCDATPIWAAWAEAHHPPENPSA